MSIWHRLCHVFLGDSDFCSYECDSYASLCEMKDLACLARLIVVSVVCTLPDSLARYWVTQHQLVQLHLLGVNLQRGLLLCLCQGMCQIKQLLYSIVSWPPASL